MSLKTNVSTTTPLPAVRKSFSMPRWVKFTPFLFVSVGAAALGVMARLPDDRIAPGVQVGQLPLEDKTLPEARAALEQFARQQQTIRFALTFPPETKIRGVWERRAEQLGLSLDVDATLEAARQAGRDHPFVAVTRLFTGTRALPVAPVPAVDVERLRATLKPIAWKVRRPAKEAQIVLRADGSLGHRRDQPGIAMNLDASAAAVETAWKDYWAKRENAAADSPHSPDAPDASEQPVPDPKPEAQNPDEPIEVTLEAQELPAKVTFDAVRQVDGLLAAYSTTYGGIANRLHNVELAASRINGVMVRPGEVFSYNTVVGPRTRRAGFLEAPEIVRGRHQMGVGGGVCQVSSTLYNAVLRANLKVVQRAHHAFPIGYVPHGCDATVAYGAIDFQFQNDTDIPIYITATTNRSRRRLTFRIFGKTVPGREVSIQTGNISSYPYTTITRTDSSLPAGRRIVEARGHSGLRVTVTRVIKENGEVVRREVVSRDHYRAVPAIVVVGTGARPSPTTAPPPADTTAPAAPVGTPEE